MPIKTDSEVEQWVLRELSLSEKVSSREICVLARDGVLRLQGSARGEEDRLAVEEAVSRATGVISVVNEVRVKPCTTLIKRIPRSVPLPQALRQDTLIHRIPTQYSVAKTTR